MTRRDSLTTLDHPRTDSDTTLPDEDFIRRAIEQSDHNALRIALYQATGDEQLIQVRVECKSVRGGQLIMADVADDDLKMIRERAFRFLTEELEGFTPTRPSDPELRRLMGLLRDTELSDKDWRYHRDIAAFDEHPRAARWTQDAPELPTDFGVVIVGAGIGGIVMAVQLGRLGIPYTIYERRHELGGTWSRNRYPDVRVDVTNFVYQYTFERDYRWTEYFARGPEVRGYLEHIAKKYGVWDHIRFDTDVTAATFDESADVWRLELQRDGVRQAASANVIVSAAGLFSVPKPLDLPGIEDFQGRITHTAEMAGDETYEGKRVAVFGNGSTGVQLLGRVAGTAAHVDVHVRTPQWIVAREKYGEPITPETQWLLSAMPYYPNWYAYAMLAMQMTSQRLHIVDREWQAKGGTFNEPNDNLRTSLTAYIEGQLAGHPDLIAKLVPKHLPMARRQIADNKWFQTLLQPHVDLVMEAVERVTATGIRTVDGTEREVDEIIAATGYQVTKYLHPTVYTGLGGERLDARWDADPGGPRAYMGLTVPGFPNFFMIYGPNSQPRAGSLFGWFEIYTRYIGNAIAQLVEGGHRRMTVRPEVFEAYNEELDARSAETAWMDPMSKERNYYVNDAGRQQVNASWNVEDYYTFFERVRPEDYDIR